VFTTPNAPANSSAAQARPLVSPYRQCNREHAKHTKINPRPPAGEPYDSLLGSAMTSLTSNLAEQGRIENLRYKPSARLPLIRYPDCRGEGEEFNQLLTLLATLCSIQPTGQRCLHAGPAWRRLPGSLNGPRPAAEADKPGNEHREREQHQHPSLRLWHDRYCRGFRGFQTSPFE